MVARVKGFRVVSHTGLVRDVDRDAVPFERILPHFEQGPAPGGRQLILPVVLHAGGPQNARAVSDDNIALPRIHVALGVVGQSVRLDSDRRVPLRQGIELSRRCGRFALILYWRCFPGRLPRRRRCGIRRGRQRI